MACIRRAEESDARKIPEAPYFSTMAEPVASISLAMTRDFPGVAGLAGAGNEFLGDADIHQDHVHSASLSSFSMPRPAWCIPPPTRNLVPKPAAGPGSPEKAHDRRVEPAVFADGSVASRWLSAFVFARIHVAHGRANRPSAKTFSRKIEIPDLKTARLIDRQIIGEAAAQKIIERQRVWKQDHWRRAVDAVKVEVSAALGSQRHSRDAVLDP